eukprot:6489275-Amphidinium_carterae.1
MAASKELTATGTGVKGKAHGTEMAIAIYGRNTREKRRDAHNADSMGARHTVDGHVYRVWRGLDNGCKVSMVWTAVTVTQDSPQNALSRSMLSRSMGSCRRLKTNAPPNRFTKLQAYNRNIFTNVTSAQSCARASIKSPRCYKFG